MEFSIPKPLPPNDPNPQPNVCLILREPATLVTMTAAGQEYTLAPAGRDQCVFQGHVPTAEREYVAVRVDHDEVYKMDVMMHKGTMRTSDVHEAMDKRAQRR